MEMQVEQGTNVGLEREENQDDLGWFSPNKDELFIVADGMGGEAGGKTAAKMAISTIKEVFEKGGGSVHDLLKTSTEAVYCPRRRQPHISLQRQSTAPDDKRSFSYTADD